MRTSSHLDWRNRLRETCAVLFSLYFAFLLVSGHDRGGSSWSVDLLYQYKLHFHPDQMHVLDDDYRLSGIGFALIWGAAIAVYLFGLLLRPFRKLNIVMLGLIGIVGVCGFPIVCLYAGGNHSFVFYLELILAMVFVFLFFRGSRSLSGKVGVALLTIHFALWSWLGGGYQLVGAWRILWPSWYWHTRLIWHWAWLLYPAFGLLLTLVWGGYLRESESKARL